MSNHKSKPLLISHKDDALSKIDSYIVSLIESDDTTKQSKADKLCYWLKDYISYLDAETSFSPSQYKRYKRGDIIKVHLGFNIGSEEGGLHYAVVIDVSNSIHNPVVTVIPLSSVKPGTDVSALHRSKLFLGNELFISLNAKLNNQIKLARQLSEALDEMIVTAQTSGSLIPNHEMTEMERKLRAANDLVRQSIRVKQEIQRMKEGSIALISQITTISKLRIYDPKKSDGILSGIKLSDDKLNEIDECLSLLYTHNKPSKRGDN